jgi:hypothetical protein
MYAITLPFFFMGIIKNRKNEYLFLLFAVLSLGLHLIFPGGSGLRYIISLIPFYIFFTIKGLLLIDFQNIFNISSKKIIYICSILLILFFYAQNITAMIHPSVNDSPTNKNSQELFSFLKNNTPEDSIISFFKPRVMYFYTQRKTNLILTPEFLQKSSTDYFVAKKNESSSSMMKYLKQHYTSIYEDEMFFVYDLSNEK